MHCCECESNHPSFPARVRWTFEWPGGPTMSFRFEREERFRMLLNTEQKVRATLNPITAGGNPAPVQNPTWEADDVNGAPIVAVTPDPGNALVCEFRALPLPEGAPTSGLTTQVRCRFDADLGTGVRELLAVGEITVVPAEAVIGTIAFGTPEQQEPPAPEPPPGS